MPIATPDSKVLVTGANGYIGVWLVRTLLEQGYSVRAAIRSTSRAGFMIDLFRSYGDKFELSEVEDITADGAFHNAVKNVGAIVHTASPVLSGLGVDPNEIVGPAVNGTLEILKSALLHGVDVKRVIIVGSTASILRTPREPIVLTENDWNQESIDEFERLGWKSLNKYSASKTLAERNAWAFYHEHRQNIAWDLTVIISTYVYGPTLIPLASPSELNLSLKLFFDAIVDPAESPNHLANGGLGGWVDVRDLAFAITKSLRISEAGNERIIVCAGSAIWQDWLDAAHSLLPFPIPSHALGSDKALLVGNPGTGKTFVRMIQFDASKSREILQMEYRSMQETARDMLAYFEGQGW
ncbi:hypothetical protein AX15_006180 [Amanita polypyramis BW_CC]|nr:hypothetical protein AX15_006180 [Amanita polypyramis BW_CC]